VRCAFSSAQFYSGSLWRRPTHLQRPTIPVSLPWPPSEGRRKARKERAQKPFVEFISFLERINKGQQRAGHVVLDGCVIAEKKKTQ